MSLLHNYVSYLTSVLGLERLQWASGVPDAHVPSCTLPKSCDLMVVWRENGSPEHHFWGSTPATDIVKKMIKAIDHEYTDVAALRLEGTIPTLSQVTPDCGHWLKHAPVKAILVFGMPELSALISQKNSNYKIFQTMDVVDLVSVSDADQIQVQQNKKQVWDQLKEVMSFLRTH